MGGIVGGKGGGSPDMHTVSQQSQVLLPDWLEGAYRGIAGEAGDQYFGGNPFAEQTLTGLTSLEGLSMDPSQIPGYANSFNAFQDFAGGGAIPNQSGPASQFLVDALNGGSGAAQQYLQSTLAGDYLHGGSGFNAALDAAGRQILPQVKSAFNSSGRTGGGLAQAAMAEELGDVFAGMYQGERSRQQQAADLLNSSQFNAANMLRQGQAQAMGMAPSMYNLAMAPAQTMMGVGNVLENKPRSDLNAYINQLSGIGPLFAGESSTSQQPVYDSGGAGLLGSALSLGSMFMGNPFGGAGLSLGAPASSMMTLGDIGGGFDLFPF